MSDAPRRERRSPMVMLLDAATRLAIVALAKPQPRVRAAGNPRRAGMIWLVAGVVLAVAGTAVVVGALLAGPGDLSLLPPHAAARKPAAVDPVPSSPVRSAAEAAAAVTTTTTPDPSSAPAAPSTGSAAPPAAAAVPLTARYATAGGGTGLLGYTAEVTIGNPGVTRHDGWRLTLTLPRDTLQVAQVSGAVARQDGATWTFEPDATTRSVPASRTVLISFEVQGATLLGAAPTDCRIDGRACSGVDGSPAP
jgi:hypothetical protein